MLLQLRRNWLLLSARVEKISCTSGPAKWSSIALLRCLVVAFVISVIMWPLPSANNSKDVNQRVQRGPNVAGSERQSSSGIAFKAPFSLKDILCRAFPRRQCRVFLAHKLGVQPAGEVKPVWKEAHNKSTMCSLYSSLPCCSLSTSWHTLKNVTYTTETSYLFVVNIIAWGPLLTNFARFDKTVTNEINQFSI